MRKNDKMMNQWVWRLSMAIDKSEIRMWKSERNSKYRCSNSKNLSYSFVLNLIFGTFGFISNFGFRASNLGFLAEETVSKRPSNCICIWGTTGIDLFIPGQRDCVASHVEWSRWEWVHSHDPGRPPFLRVGHKAFPEWMLQAHSTNSRANPFSPPTPQRGCRP